MVKGLLVLLPLAATGLACGVSPAVSSDAGGAPRDATLPPESATDGREEPRSAAYLTELRVAGSPSDDGGVGAPFVLVPGFDPDIHDYYVRCGAGPNAMTVTLTGGPGSVGLLTAPTVSASAAHQSVAITIEEDDAIVAIATKSTATTEYWVRCLPHDFPPLQMIRHEDAGAPPRGYYLVGNGTLVQARWGYAMIVDGNGVPVWYVHGVPGQGITDVERLILGTVSFAPDDAFVIYTLDPLTSATLAPAGEEFDVHELRVLPDGHDLVLSNETATVDMTGLRVGLPDGGTTKLGKGTTITGCRILEFDPSSGEVTWIWNALDHIDPVKNCTFPELDANRTGPYGAPVYDVFHCNSIDVDPASRNLLLSARNMDALFYIERSTGSILWKLGGAVDAPGGATYVEAKDSFHRQHDARLQPDWSPTCAGGRGHITVFDDESAEAQPARALELDVVVGARGAADCGAGPPGATRSWQYVGDRNSSIEGSFRISSDGSRVIGWGAGAPNLVFTEVDREGNDLLDFYFTDGSGSYRAVKVPLDAFDLQRLRTTAGRGAR